MSREVQRVLVIHDASKKLCTKTVKWALHLLSLKPGDKIKFLGVVQALRPANTLPFMGCPLLLGNKSRLHSSATIKKKQEVVEKERRNKLDEYQNNAEMKELIQVYEMQQIELESAVEAGHSLKEVTIQAAKNLEATCVILDRQMKKDQKYLMENLTCGILRMRHDCSIEHLREPQAVETDIDRGQSSHTILEVSLTREKPQEIFDHPICSLCKSTWPRVGFFREFTFKELQAATLEFSPQFLLPKCGRGIYKGVLPNGLQIVVKEHTFFSNEVGKHILASIKEVEFNSEVQILGKARHENVAMLLGSCSENGHRLLVYEYVCNGSLDQHLSVRNGELTWERRMKIALGSAKGLQYLHRKNIYGNIRPKNILITHDHKPLITNFGLTRNQYKESSDQSSGGDRVMRTFEYLAPEYGETGKDSSQNDIYSFGVILLKLITGLRTTEDTNAQPFLRWARPLLQEKNYGDLIDPRVQHSHDLYQLFWMVRVVEKCLNWEPDRRYSINKVVNLLTSITEGSNVEDYSPPESDCSEQITG